MPGIMVAAGEGGREKVAGAAWVVEDMSLEDKKKKKKKYNKREKKGETGEEARPTSRGGKTSGHEVEREGREEGTSAEMFQQKVSC